MGYPASYFSEAGLAIEGAAYASSAYALAEEPDRLGGENLRQAIEVLNEAGLVVTLKHEPFPGQVARVKIDAYGRSAAEVEATLLEYAERCAAAAQAGEVAYGQCVIERNLTEEWGAAYSWRGRVTLHPTIGTVASSERASAAVADD